MALVTLLVDVRAGDMRTGEPIPAALHVEKEDVATLFDPTSGTGLDVGFDRTIVVFCGRTTGSERVLRALRRLGYTRLRHVEGGYAALVAATH